MTDASQVNTNFNDIISALTDSTKDLDIGDITATTGTITTGTITTLTSTTATITTCKIGDGSVTAPSLALNSDADGSGTGLYRVGANSLGFTANGVNVGSYTSSGAWTLGPAAGNSVAHVMYGRSLTLSHAAATSAYFQIINTSTSNAILDLAVQGAGDPFIYLNGAGISTAWYCGLDNSASEIFCIGAGAAPGASDFFTITGGGIVTIGTGTSTVHKLNSAVQTTVGAAGAASALPANPTGYFLLEINGSARAIPYYAAS